MKTECSLFIGTVTLIDLQHLFTTVRTYETRFTVYILCESVFNPQRLAVQISFKKNVDPETCIVDADRAKR